VSRLSAYANATQAVFGEGRLKAEVISSRAARRPGRPRRRAVRRPGREAARPALEEAGIDRGTTYVTNAVKPLQVKARVPGGSTTSQPGRRLWRAARGSTPSLPS